MERVTSPFAWRVSKATVKPINAIVVLQQPRRLVLNISIARISLWSPDEREKEKFLKPDSAVVACGFYFFELLKKKKKLVNLKEETNRLHLHGQEKWPIQPLRPRQQQQTLLVAWTNGVSYLLLSSFSSLLLCCYASTDSVLIHRRHHKSLLHLLGIQQKLGMFVYV